MKNIMKKVLLGSLCFSAISFSALSIGAVQAAEVEGPKIKWLVSLWGNRRGLTEGIEELAAIVSEKTDGNFELSLQYGGILSEPKENIDGLQLGAFEAAMFCPIYHPGKTPALTGIDLAYLPIKTLDARKKVVETYYTHPIVQAEFERWNISPLLGGLLPSYEIMGKGEEPKTPEDWKGIRLNASGGVAALMKAIGANPTTIPAPDAFTSLDRGIVDGVAYPYTYAFAAYKLHETSNWVTDNWGLGTIVCHFAANKQAYSSLPEQYKKLLSEAKEGAYKHQISAYAEIDVTNEKLFAEQNLVRIAKTDAIAKAIADAVDPSWENWVEESTSAGLPGRELLDYILDAAKKAE